MKINQLITKVNYQKATNRNIDYLVIHYVGATGTAKDNCRYFEKFYRGASAHYFVGHSGDVWQCVEDNNIAWHCGSSKYKHKYCRNSNSIGIEMCCRKAGDTWYFEEATVNTTLLLVKELMAKYNIPAANVIRHYDVSGKICPAPYVKNNTQHTWEGFKAKIAHSPNLEALALEVIRGKWGNGEARKRNLKAAGYDYAAIQKLVNEMLK